MQSTRAWLLTLCLIVPEPLQAASIPGLFNTGVADNGALLAGGAVDPHYRLIASSDATYTGPAAYVLPDAYPAAPAGPWLANGPDSKWLSPRPSGGANVAAGNYTYRLQFSLAGLDPNTAVITGRWSSDNAGVDILLNGVSTGINYDGSFGAFSGVWTLRSGFVAGTNTLDFVINNAGTAANPCGFRCELSGTAELPPPPGTPPEIRSQPASAAVVAGDAVAFTVGVYGSTPLQYQWRHNGTNLPGATNSTLSLPSVSTADAGAYDVRVVNSAGSALSAAAVLTVIPLRPGQTPPEALGPATRRTPLVFSEIMYHPQARADGRNLEFVELYNAEPWPQDLGGWRLAGGWDYVFPPGTTIAGLGFLVVAAAPGDVEAVYGLNGVLGGLTNRLSNSGDRLQLIKRSGAIVLEVAWSDEPPWPVAADGAGHSLVLARPSFGQANPAAWAASAWFGGSPGGPDPLVSTPEDAVVINEWLAHSAPPWQDFLELYNDSAASVDLSGCWLSDDPTTNKFRIPDGTVLGPRQWLAFDQTQLGFALSAGGEAIVLVNSNRTRVIDATRFGGQALNTAAGRDPDGTPVFSTLAAPTPGAANAPRQQPAVVINEIYFHPISGDPDDEFVELFNPGTAAVDLSGWRLGDGIDFGFPGGTTLPAGGYLVLARNTARLLTNYPHLNAANCLGNFGGGLSDAGERLSLQRPEYHVTTNAQGQVITNTHFSTVCEVSYADRSRWSRYADGGGSSLELMHPRADSRLAVNWADSDETAKAPWTLVEFTGTVDNAMSGVNADRVQLMLLGQGEALVDNVEVIESGANRVPNGTFESGTNGWVFQGTHIRSTLETAEGYNSARSLRLRASERGEPIGNRVYAPLSATVPLNATVTLRARVRWLAGAPEFLMRLRGGGIEAAARLAVAPNPGTPGLANTRARSLPGPAITSVSHRPLLPGAGVPIRVAARIEDPDLSPVVYLSYRLDPGTTVNTLPMRDDGSGGDLVAGDRVFTATLPGQNHGAMIAFRIIARGGTTNAFPASDPAREALIRVGETVPTGPFGTYRIWMTQATLDTWAVRGNLSNDPLDVTFVYGDSRAIYAAGACYGGSPAMAPGFNSPVGNLSPYDIFLPADEAVIGEDHFTLDFPVRDATNEREQLMHWIADQYNLPNLHRRDVLLFINGYRRGNLYHDTQQPGGDLLEEWFPADPDGWLYKSTQWSEGTDAGSPESILLNSLQRFTSGGQLKIARYRWNWRPRAADSQLDFTNLLALVETVNASSSAYEAAVSGLVDIEDWMRMFAMNDLCSYWDGFGNPNAKNTFLYRARHERWRLIPWDFDVGLGVFNDPVDAALFPSNVDPPLQRLYNTPAFVRIYWRELQAGVNSFFQGSVVTPWLGAREAAYRTNGFSFTSPFVPSGPYNLSVPAWIDARRNFLLTQLASVAAVFSVANPPAFATNRNLALLSGTAPVGVATLTVNGVAWPVTWSSVTAWRLQVPLQPGSNTLALAALDRAGQVLTNRTLVVEYTSAPEPLEDLVVINEINYNPAVPGASYIELFNRSASNTVDLSGWRIEGVDFDFPPGTLLGPRSFAVLAANRVTFLLAYGAGVPVLGEFPGNLDNGGETLTLMRPGAVPGQWLVVDRVTYDDDAPWPASADGGGAALQLVSPDQDNSRVSNWGDASGWRFFSVTTNSGSQTSVRLSVYFSDANGGEVYLDDVALVAETGPDAGTNLIRNGGFESPTLAPWAVDRVATNSSLTETVVHSGRRAFRLLTVPGSPSLTDFYQDLVLPVATNTVYTLSFWFLPTGKGNSLNWRLHVLCRPVADIRPAAAATPGAANSTLASLPPYPPLWLSEVEPSGAATVPDNLGEPEPWIEIYNAGPDPLSLEDCALSDSYTNLLRWTFPAGSVIQPGHYRLIWADGEPGEQTDTDWHTSFRLAPGNGTVVLSRLVNGVAQILDYFNYRNLEPGQSYGAFPPGQASYRQRFAEPTPGLLNNPAPPVVSLFINEWMAANQGVVLDPADHDADDWFEIFNPNFEPINLQGFTLTDNPANPAKFVIPAGFTIPARGYLLVWADEETGQTQTNGHLHVNFRLAQSGESIGLYDPAGRVVDLVAFGPQAVNLSEGRWPDGASATRSFTAATPGAMNVVTGCGQEPALLTAIAVDDAGQVTLTWSAQPGCHYRVQVTENLPDGDWQDVPGDVAASSGLATKVIPNGGAGTQRFFRVVALP